MLGPLNLRQRLKLLMQQHLRTHPRLLKTLHRRRRLQGACGPAAPPSELGGCRRRLPGMMRLSARLWPWVMRGWRRWCRTLAWDQWQLPLSPSPPRIVPPSLRPCRSTSYRARLCLSLPFLDVLPRLPAARRLLPLCSWIWPALWQCIAGQLGAHSEIRHPGGSAAL